MKNIGKIIGINLAILLVYSVLIRAANGGGGTSNEKGLGILIVSAGVISLHVFVNLIIMAYYFFDKNNTLGKSWLLSSGIVLLVGFSTCLGNAMLG